MLYSQCEARRLLPYLHLFPILAEGNLQCIVGSNIYYNISEAQFDQPVSRYRAAPVAIIVPWTIDTAPTFCILRSKESNVLSLFECKYVPSIPALETTYFANILASFTQLHEDGTTTPCGTLEHK